MATQFSIHDGKRWKARFFTIWGGQALSLLGSQLVQFALIWHLTVTTGSATVLATAALVGMLPSVILGPLVGTLVDRWNRRWIMVLADSITALATVALIILWAMNIVTLWQIYLVLFVRALAGGFHGHAMSASTSLMVPVEHLTRIQGINQMLIGGLSVVAAPLGALLLELLPLQGILAIDVVTALFAILPLCVMPIPQPERIEQGTGQPATRSTIWQDFKAGLRYILGWPGLLLIGLMTVGINFTIIPAFSLLPLLVKTYFGGNAMQLGWVEAGLGIGMLLGGMLLGVWGGFTRKIVTSMVGLMGMGVGTLLIAVAPPTALLLVIVAAFLIGVTNAMTTGPFLAIIQSNVEPAMQARVLSLLSSIGSAMVPLGLIIAGPIADTIGIHAWFFLGGALCIVMAVAGLCTPAVMNIEGQRSQTVPTLSTRVESRA